MEKNISNDMALVLSLIPKSVDHEDTITISEIRQVTHFSKMKIKRIIQDLREFFPICSLVTSPYGYYLTYNKSELKYTIKRLQDQSFTMWQTAIKLSRFMSDGEE